MVTIPKMPQPKVDKDAVPLHFGKYKGKTPNEVSETDPSYIVWMHDSHDDSLVSDDLYNYCLDEKEKEDFYK